MKDAMRVSEPLRQPKSPSTRILWIPLAIILGYLAWPGILTAWPPDWLERHQQRQKILERVQAVGGWSAVQRDCDAIAQQHKDDGFYWSRGRTNILPVSLAALKPSEIRIAPLTRMNEFKGEPPLVSIKIFGMHSTGGHSTPYFALEILSDSQVGNYRPSRAVAASGNSHDAYHKVTDRIYEVY